MNPKKPVRSPLLNLIRKAFYLSKESEEKGIPLNELIDQSKAYDDDRRRFIGNVAKVGAVVGGAGLLNACTKASDFIENHSNGGVNGASLATQPKVVVVGAGMAGLNCAYQLKKSGYTCSVYEASTRSGGRMFSKKDLLNPGTVTELGGEFIDSTHKDMIQLCNDFGLSLADTFAPSETSLLRDSFFIDGQLYTEPQIIQAFQPYAARIAADIKTLPPYIGYDKNNAASKAFDAKSISAYFDSIGMTGWIRTGLEVAYVTEYGLENTIQSSINFLYLFSPDTTNGFEIFGVSDERYKIIGGNSKLTDALFTRVQSQVTFQYKLVKINKEVKGYSLFFQDANGTTQKVLADIIVLTIPFTTLRNVQINVPFPTVKTNSIQNLGYGTNSKLLLGFTSRVWRNYNNTGYMFTNGAMQTGWDNTQLQPGTLGGYTIYQGGNLGVALGNGTPQSQAPQFLAQLDQMWPGCNAAYNGKAERFHWPTNPNSLGSYAAYKVNQWTTIGGAEKEAVGNIFFAGEHCSFLFQGFMNGAAETGKNAAQKVVAAIKTP